jgi:nucleotide-binding universal stress UspA family protein
MSSSRAPILLCYDGSPAAARAIDAAGTLFPGRPAIVLYVASTVAADRVRTTAVQGVREELIEEVRVAARREAAAVAEEGTSLAQQAGLKAKPLTVDRGGGTAEAIVRVAEQESAAAIVVGRSSRARRRPVLDSSMSHSVIDRSSMPVVVVLARAPT